MEHKNREEHLKGILLRLVVIFISAVIMSVNLKSFVQTGDLFPGGFTFQRAEEYCANLERKMEHFSGYRPPVREKEKQLPEDGEHSAE